MFVLGSQFSNILFQIFDDEPSSKKPKKSADTSETSDGDSAMKDIEVLVNDNGTIAVDLSLVRRCSLFLGLFSHSNIILSQKTPTAPQGNKRPEIVRVPYIRVSSRIDAESTNYIKAMSVLSKTDPTEAAKVLDEIPPAPSRKRPRSSSFYDFDDAHSGPQGALSISHDLYSFVKGRLVSNLTQKQIDKFTPKRVNELTESAKRAIADQSRVGLPDDAVMRQERHVRSHMANCAHQLQHFLRTRDYLAIEHKRLMAILDQRRLRPSNSGSIDMCVILLRYFSCIINAVVFSEDCSSCGPGHAFKACSH